MGARPATTPPGKGARRGGGGVGRVQGGSLLGADPDEHQHGRDSVRALRFEDFLQGTPEREEGREVPMTHRATITLEGPQADVVRQALSPEAGGDGPKAPRAAGGAA